MPDTHIVTNQAPPLENYNPATSPVLIEALIREGGQWGLDEVTELGALSGSQQAQRWGELADRNRPILRTHDRYGHRIDEVEYDPAYHELMRVAVGHGLHAAPAPGGLSCFFLPRVLPDGTRNRMFLQRLKDKLGNHANASSEVEYDGATAWLVGEEGRGVPTIIEMVNLTRLDCALGSATSMRTGLIRAIHHAQHRKAFGAYLIDQPLMRNVLADLAVEAEAATIVAMRMAGATDNALRGDEKETLLRRVGLAASKYGVCKRATPHAAEALECLGGNGYVEESGMPRLYREAPLMGIWEGSGNVSALDTLRAMATRPECVEVLFGELAKSTGQDARRDSHVEGLGP